MDLHNKMVSHGHLMFRWRSYLPFLLLGPFLLAVRESAQINGYFQEDTQHLWVLLCVIISILGLFIRWITVGFVPAGTSGRNTKGQRAEVLNQTGMYSIVRNPLYLGNFITILGVLLSLKVWWLVVIGSFGFFIYMERIILAEEKFLSDKFGESYNNWRSKTPVILPNLKLWINPAIPFSFKTVVKREYPGILGLATAFFFTEILVDLVFEGEDLQSWLIEDAAWPIIFGIVVIFAVCLRIIKKNTSLLKVKGR